MGERSFHMRHGYAILFAILFTCCVLPAFADETNETNEILEAQRTYLSSLETDRDSLKSQLTELESEYSNAVEMCRDARATYFDTQAQITYLESELESAEETWAGDRPTAAVTYMETLSEKLAEHKANQKQAMAQAREAGTMLVDSEPNKGALNQSIDQLDEEIKRIKGVIARLTRTNSTRAEHYSLLEKPYVEIRPQNLSWYDWDLIDEKSDPDDSTLPDEFAECLKHL